MLRFNTFRAKRYLRSKFVEGAFLLASEASDIELEILDLLRKTVEDTLGDVAIEDAWKVERISDTEILIKPGEAWFKGLPFVIRGGKDQLVSGAILSVGTVPIGVSVADDSAGAGKVLTFGTVGVPNPVNSQVTPTNGYRIVVTAREELITDVDDPFLKNANLVESTAQKIRLNFKIEIVPEASQNLSPIPYTDENSTSVPVTNFPAPGGFADPNLNNEILITPSVGSGDLVSLQLVTGAEQLDGRDLELTVNNPALANPLPIGATPPLAFQNGTLIDANGTRYHINQIFDGTVSGKSVIRIDKEPDQPNPDISGPYRLVKKNVYATDDSNGSPQGKLFWSIASLDYNTTNGIIHQSKITDLRTSIKETSAFQDVVTSKFDLFLVAGGSLTWDASTSLLTSTAAMKLISAYGPVQTIAALTQPIVDGGALIYEMDLATGGAIGRGDLAISSTSTGTSIALTGSPDLSTVRIGNTVVDDNGTVATITDVDDINDTLTVDVSMTFTSGGTIHLDSYAAESMPKDVENFVLAVRDGSKVYVGINDLELEDGETNQLGDGISSQNLTFIGATGETDNDPNYSSVTVITQGDSLTTAIGKLDAGVSVATTGANQDRSLKLVEGGTWDWTLIGSAVNFEAFSSGTGDTSGSGAPADWRGQSFTSLSAGDINSVLFRMRDTGSASGNMIVNVYADDGFGLPGVLLGTSDPINANTLTASYANIVFPFSTPVSIANSTLYHVAVEMTSVTFGANIFWDGAGGDPFAGGTNVNTSNGGATWTQGATQDLVFSVDGNTSSNVLSLGADAYIQIPGLTKERNTIPTSASPITLANDDEVAYVEVNRSAGGATNLTVNVADEASVVPNPNTAIIARRLGGEVIVGTHSFRLISGESKKLDAGASDQNLSYIGSTDNADAEPTHSSDIRGTANENLTARQGVLTDAMGDEQENRSAYFRSDDPVTWTGSQLQFTKDIVLDIVNTKTGTLTAHTVLVAGSPIALNAGESAYISIDRTTNENVTVVLSDTTPIPAQTQANKDVIIVARRVDVTGVGYLHLPLHKQVLEPGQTVRLGASGSGGGAGNSIIETIKNRLLDSTFEAVTPNVFSQDKDDLVDGASTGSFSLVTQDFEFTAASETYVSIQMLDAEFLAKGVSLNDVELLVFWSLDSIDPAATYEVSRNGGAKYQTLDMEQIADTELYRAILNFDDDDVAKVFASHTTIATVFTNMNTTLHRLAQQFEPLSSGDMDTIKVDIAVNNLGPTGTLTMDLHADDGGNEPGALIASSNALNISSALVLPAFTEYAFTFSTPQTLVNGTKYHLVLNGASITYGGNTVLMRGETSSGYVDGIPNISSDGGSSWSTSAADFQFSVEGTTSENSTLDSQATVDDTEELNASTQLRVGQAITLANTSEIREVDLDMTVNDSGSLAGNLFVSLYTDDGGGLPDELVVETNAILASTFSTGVNTINIPDKALVAGTYHIVVRTDAEYKAAFATGVDSISLDSDSAGTAGTIDGGAGFGAGTFDLFYTVRGIELDLRVRVTSSVASNMDGVAVLYDKVTSGIATGVKERQVFHFKAVADNDNTFPLTSFIPDTDLLRVYYVQAGQVFAHPGFTVDGQVITFAVDQFNNGGVEADVTLVFDQTRGGAFDNSDLNGLLLAANRLGSTDPTIDKSVAGEGILLRALGNGNKLVEASIIWNGAAYEWQFAEVT